MAEFTDAQLVIIFQKAVRRVNRKLCLTGTSEEMSIDTTTCEIVPDTNEDLKDIVLLQAECLIQQRQLAELSSSESASAGVVVKDGEQTIDTTSGGATRSKALDSSFSPCAELEEAIKTQKLARMGGDGTMIW